MASVALSPRRFQLQGFGLAFAMGSPGWKELLWEAVSNSKGNWNSHIPSDLTSDFHQLKEHFKAGAVVNCRMFYLYSPSESEPQ